MTCYCANYYSSINCHNNVPEFGDQCAHCLSTQTRQHGHEPYQNYVSQPSNQWSESVEREKMRREEERTRRERIGRATAGMV